MNNQDDNQVENQDEKNTSCNIFLEQLELLNQLPLNERGNVIYLALLKAFSRISNQLENQDDNQDENQLENTYISISKSISLSKLSISVLNLLNKTLGCKIYSKNWGGKRTGSGKKGNKPTDKPIITPTKQEIIDLFVNKYKLYFENEYKRVFNSKPFLSQQDCYKIIELSTVYSPEIITEAIKKLKNISFDDINFKPTASWLLKDNNFERVMNGEFDRQEESLTEFLNEWAKKGADNER